MPSLAILPLLPSSLSSSSLPSLTPNPSSSSNPSSHTSRGFPPSRFPRRRFTPSSAPICPSSVVSVWETRSLRPIFPSVVGFSSLGVHHFLVSSHLPDLPTRTTSSTTTTVQPTPALQLWYMSEPSPTGHLDLSGDISRRCPPSSSFLSSSSSPLVHAVLALRLFF